MHKILITLIIILSFSAHSKTYEYHWTHDHPILLDYVKNNRDNIIEYTPIKIRNSKEYSDFIYAVLEHEKVPKEIIILAGIESSFRPHVVSKSQAVGMWQFLKDTGQDWGLRVNNKVDDREDWKKSTIAAVRYLKWMANRHFDGNYEMAILAYNAGIGRVKRLSEELNTNDPWVIIEKSNLPRESKEFLPKFLSYLHYYFYLENNS